MTNLDSEIIEKLKRINNKPLNKPPAQAPEESYHEESLAADNDHRAKNQSEEMSATGESSQNQEEDGGVIMLAGPVPETASEEGPESLESLEGLQEPPAEALESRESWKEPAEKESDADKTDSGEEAEPELVQADQSLVDDKSDLVEEQNPGEEEKPESLSEDTASGQEEEEYVESLEEREEPGKKGGEKIIKFTYEDELPEDYVEPESYQNIEEPETGSTDEHSTEAKIDRTLKPKSPKSTEHKVFVENKKRRKKNR